MKNLCCLLVPLVASLSAFAADRELLIRCDVGSGKEAVVFGPSKSPMETAAVKELRVATLWDPPRATRNGEGSPIMQPLTPRNFERVQSGWLIRCAAEPAGHLIRITGTLTFSEPELVRAVYGEESGPLSAPGKRNLLLSENVSRTAVMHSSATPFQVFAVPGKNYEFQVRRLDRWVRCRISCGFAAR